MTRQSSSAGSETDALNMVLNELRRMRSEIGAIKSELSFFKEGLRGDVEVVKTAVRATQVAVSDLSKRIGGTKGSNDSANVGLRSELEVVKTAVSTTQVTVSKLSKRIDDTEARIQSSKKRRLNPERIDDHEQKRGEHASPHGQFHPKESVVMEVDTRMEGDKSVPVLTKKGFLRIGAFNKTIFFFSKFRMHPGQVKIDVDSEIEWKDNHFSWVVLKRDNWISQNYGAYASVKLALMKKKAVGIPGVEVVRAFHV